MSQNQCPDGHSVPFDSYVYCRECGKTLEPYVGEWCACQLFDFKGYTRSIRFCPKCGTLRPPVFPSFIALTPTLSDYCPACQPVPISCPLEPEECEEKHIHLEYDPNAQAESKHNEQEGEAEWRVDQRREP